jgi:hypothetical protein
MEIEACMPDAESANEVQIAKYEVQTHLAQQRAISKIMAWHQKVLQLLQCHRAHGAANKTIRACDSPYLGSCNFEGSMFRALLLSGLARICMSSYDEHITVFR